jgi:hypothetical protein
MYLGSLYNNGGNNENSFGQSGQQKPCGRRYRIMKINTQTDIHPTYLLHFAYGEAHFRKYKINIIYIYIYIYYLRMSSRYVMVC